MARILVNTRVWSVELFYVQNTLEQGRFWKFSKTAKPKVMENWKRLWKKPWKVMEIEELIRVWTLGRILALFKPNDQEHIILNIPF